MKDRVVYSLHNQLFQPLAGIIGCNIKSFIVSYFPGETMSW